MFGTLRNHRQWRSKAGDNRTVLCPSHNSFYRLLMRMDGFHCNLLKPTPCTRVSSTYVQCFPSSQASQGMTETEALRKHHIQTWVMASPSSHTFEILLNTKHNILCRVLTRISPHMHLQQQPSPVEKLDLSVWFPAASISHRKLVQSLFVQEVGLSLLLIFFFTNILRPNYYVQEYTVTRDMHLIPLGLVNSGALSWTRGVAWWAHSSWHVNPLCMYHNSVVSDSSRSHEAVARQASLSMGFPRQEYWSKLPFLPPEDLPDSGRDQIHISCISCIAGGFFTHWAIGEAHIGPERMENNKYSWHLNS